MDQYAKAIVAAVMAGLGALGTALADGSATATEWVVVASSVVAALALVWGVPNAPAPVATAAHAWPGVQPTAPLPAAPATFAGGLVTTPGTVVSPPPPMASASAARAYRGAGPLPPAPAADPGLPTT